MDFCSDDDNFKQTQIQLSHIVRYRLKQKGIGYEELYGNRFKYHAISLDKLDYLYKQLTHADPTIDYGFNVTELEVISKGTGLSLLYMFTGKDYDFLDDLYEQNRDLKARLYPTLP